jgi:hypothetical protein
MRAQWTRRQALRRGGAAAAGVVGLGLAGFIGYEWPRGSTPAAARRSPSVTPSSPGTHTSASASSYRLIARDGAGRELGRSQTVRVTAS